ncbi:putative ribonuclease H-like domain-containing protein, partial [Tanacetum coccineum]
VSSISTTTDLLLSATKGFLGSFIGFVLDMCVVNVHLMLLRDYISMVLNDHLVLPRRMQISTLVLLCLFVNAANMLITTASNNTKLLVLPMRTVFTVNAAKRLVREFESAQSNTTAKLPILKLGEYKMWVIRIKQYFQVQDYALWEVIENGNSWVFILQTAQENGTSVTKMLVHVTTEEKTNKKNDVKARSLLLMALPNEHQLTFSRYNDAKTMFAAIETRFRKSLDSFFNRLHKIVSRLAILGIVITQEDLNSKFLRSLPPEWNTHVVVWINKDEFKIMSIDDLYNNFKIVEQSVKKSVGASSGAQNLAFMTAPSTSISTASFSDNAAYAFMVENPNGSNLLQQDLEKIHEDDLEAIDLKWQLSLLSMRANRYFQRTSKKSFINANDTAGYDKSKVECFNCHKMRLFARECRAPRNKEGQFRNQDNTKKHGNNEDTSSKAMLAIDGLGFDWSDMARTGLATIEEQLITYRKNEVLFSEEVIVLKREVACKDYEINVLKNAAKENSNDSLVKEQVLEDTSIFVESSLNVDKETVFLDKKIKFVKPKNHEKPVKKSVRYNEMYRSQSPSFDHVQAHCKYHQKERMVYGNNYNRVNYNYTTNRTHPNAQRNMVPGAVLMKTGLKPFNTARTVNTAHPKSIILSAKPCFSKLAQSTIRRPFQSKTVLSNKRFTQTNNTAKAKAVNTARPKAVNTIRRHSALINIVRVNQENAVKALACWVWRPTKLDSVSISLKKHNYIDARGRSKSWMLKAHDVLKMTKPMLLVLKGSNTELLDETSEILKNFIKEIENLVDKKVKIIRSDNGIEFKNKIMDDFCREKGIRREYSVARTPQQNGEAKRRNRTLIKAARTMLADSRLPTTFWVKAISTVCYVHNRVFIDKPYNKTPYKLFKGFKPALSFMRPFGCHVTILNTLDNLGKFDSKSDEENKPMIKGNGPKWLFDIDSLTQSMNYVPVVAAIITNEFTGTQGELNAGTSTQKEEISQDCIVMPSWKDTSYFDSPSKDVGNGEPNSAAYDQKQVIDGPDNRNDEKDKSKDDSSPNEVNTVGQHVNTAGLEVNTSRFKLNNVDPSVNTASSYDPDSPKDIFKMGASHTLEATHVEFFSDKDEPEVDLGNILNSYTVPTTLNIRIHKDHPIKNVIGFLNIEPTSIAKALSDSSWVEAMQEIFLQFKLQQGHKQEEGINYEEVFAPVARIKAIRLFLAYASFIGFLIYQMDVKSAFLFGTIEEEVYVTQPPGYKDPDHLDKVYKVVKALYGLHQAPRAWYETLANYLLGNVLKRGKIDQTLFIKKQKGDILLVHVYVDDIIFGSTNKELCTGFEKLMKDKFQMSSMGELTFFLGLQVHQKEDGIFISQDKYVDEILKKFNYIDVKSTSTPVDLEKPLVKNGDANDVDVHLYRSMIGSLMYLTTSRPDIMFVVCACARFQVTLKTSHLLALKRIFIYLKGKPTLGLWYSRDSLFELVAYTNSDYAGATQDRKSTTGGFAVEKYSGFKTNYWIIDLLTNGFDAGSQKEVGTLRYLSLVVPLKKVGDEAVHKELGDRMERAATTASSLEAEQESGSGPRCQDTIVGGVDAQTRFETTSKKSNDPPLSRGLTLGSREDSMKLLELMANCTKLCEMAIEVNAVTAVELLTTVRHHLVLPVQVNAVEAKAKTINGERQLQALVDKKKVIITETSIRSDLHLEDAGGTDCLPTATIFEELARMGAKTTAWNEFSSTMASAIICLATNQKINLSKYIFDAMLGDMSHHKKIYVTPSHTKKIFANMKREGKDFSRRVTPLFATIMVQANQEGIPINSQQIPITTQLSTSKPQKKQSRRKQSKNTKVPHTIDSTADVPNEEHVPIHSHDPLLSGEDRMKL